MPSDRADAPQSAKELTDGASFLLVPVTLAIAGAVLRYLAYASTAPHPSPQGFVDAMCVWDCYWYGDIVQHGYQAYPEVLNFGGPGGIANWAFFPLYPLLIATLRQLVDVSPATLGAIVSPLLTLVAVLVARPLFHGDRRAYWLFAALLLMGPFSFYFSILYSESLFVLLTVVAFVLLERRYYGAAGIAGGLLSATRTVGELIVFALVTEALMDLASRPPGTRLRRVLDRPDILLGMLLVPAGLFAFMVILYLRTGDALGFAHIQRAWDREMGNPFGFLWAAFTASGGQVRDGSLLALSSVAGLGLCLALAVQRRLPAAIFCALTLLLSLSNGLESMLRFVAALAPLSIAASVMLARWRPVFWGSLLIFAVLDFELTKAWLGQRGALM